MSYGGYDGGATQFAGGYMAECVNTRFVRVFFSPTATIATRRIPGTTTAGGRWMGASGAVNFFLKKFRIIHSTDGTIATRFVDARWMDG